MQTVVIEDSLEEIEDFCFAASQGKFGAVVHVGTIDEVQKSLPIDFYPERRAKLTLKWAAAFLHSSRSRPKCNTKLFKCFRKKKQQHKSLRKEKVGEDFALLNSSVELFSLICVFLRELYYYLFAFLPKLPLVLQRQLHTCFQGQYIPDTTVFQR